MKNLLLATILITLTFLSCSKKDDDTLPDITPPDTTIYEGTWRGTFSGDVSGTWIYNVTGKGTLTGSGTPANDTVVHTKTGTVSASGLVNVKISNGGSNTGQFDAESGTYTGTWKNNNPNNPLSGTLYGTKD